MAEKKSVCFITKNIPVKRVEGNPVILNLLDSISDCESVSIIFPAEYVPSFLSFFGSRLSKYSELKGTVCLGAGINVYFFRFISLPFFRYSTLPFFSKLWIKKNKILLSSFKIFHAHYIFPDGCFAHQINKITGTPYVVTVREGDFSRLSRLSRAMQDRAKDILFAASSVTVPSYALQEKCVNLFGLSPEVIPHGIDLSSVAAEWPGQNDNAEYSGVRLLTVSQLIERKNVNWVVSFASTFGYHLDVVGDGPQLSDLKEAASGKNNVNFLGWLPPDEVYAKMAEADIFILPSENETFGMVYLEAAANGCVVVAKEKTGIYKLFNEEEALFVSSKEDMNEKLRHLINNKELMGRYKDKALTRVSDFEIDKIRDKYLNLYNGLS
jgi:glycosyltransferase involved in cell wall biosynthesis